MVKNLITELTRTREIMGLEDNNNNLLTEQRKFVDDMVKVFLRKGMTKEAIEALGKRLELLFAKQTKRIGSLIERMAIPDNFLTKASGAKYLKSVTGAEFKFSNVEKVMRLVSTGKLGGDDLVDMLKLFPKHLADGLPFRASFLKEMQKLESKVLAELEKTAVEKGGVATKEVTKKIETVTVSDLEAIIAQNLKNSGRGWWKDIKLRMKDFVFGKNIDGDVALLKNNALLKFLEKSNVKSMDDLSKLLKELKDQAIIGAEKKNVRWLEGLNPDQLTKQIAAVLKENSERIARGADILELPPGVVDDIQSLVLLTNQRGSYMNGLNAAWVRRRIKDLNAAIKKGGEKVDKAALRKERDDLLQSILGTKVDESITKNLGTFTAKINKGTLGGLGRWAIRDVKNIAKTLGFFTITWLINEVVAAVQNQLGGTKAIAGLTKNLYQKFRGHKWMIHVKGGLSDDNAKKGALLLKKYVRGWALIRDLSESSNFATRLDFYCKDDEEYKNGGPKIKGTLMGCTEENKLRFWNATVEEDGDVADWSPWMSAGDVGAFKFITGTDDTAILNFYKNYVPSILASSQITYFYEDGQSYELLDDLDMMSSQLPIIGTIENIWWGKTKATVMKVLNNTKPWVIGEGKAGTNFALAVSEITTNWPSFVGTRQTTAGVEYYSAYKTGAKIPPARLAAITDENNYVAGSFDEDDVYVAPENFNLWIDALTVEEFGDGFCAGIKGDCEPYLLNKPDENTRLKGYDTAKIKAEVSTVLKRLITEFQNSNFWNNWVTADDVKTIRGEQVDVDLAIESVNTKPVMEGLIRILLNDLKK